MPSQEIYEEMVRRISDLESRLKHAELERKKFEILNVERVVLSTTPQNAWDIPDVDEIAIEASVAAITINGIANGRLGRALYLFNPKGGTTISLTHNSGSAALADRVYTSTAATVTLSAGKSALLVYNFEVNVGDYGWRVFFVAP